MSRLLFWLGCAASAGLTGLVAVAPFLGPRPGVPGVVVLFAGDGVVRRTAVAAALGLLAAAWVFFRPVPTRAGKTKARRPPADAMGA